MTQKELNNQNITRSIRAEALKIGFLDCGFSKVRALEEYSQPYLRWVQKGQHAGMLYMQQNMEKRLNPSLLVEGSKSVISLLYNYFSFEKLNGSELLIAKYAFGADYHEVIKNKLDLLVQFITEQAGDVTVRRFVDTAPVLEKAWAQNSGLGFIGKNSCLISRKYGSFVFVAEVITSLELEEDKPSGEFCGSCRRCIDNCPTRAITEERTIDCNLCISYQTIENRGEIPSSLKGKFNNYIFGCDICQDVCPWNRRSKPHTEPQFSLNRKISEMSAEDWEKMDEATFRDLFGKSAVKRTKFTGLKRNIQFIRTSEM